MESYELIDLESGNLVGSYSSEEEASAIVRDAFDESGEEGVRALALLKVSADAGQQLIAQGMDLVHSVRRPVLARP